MNYSIIRYVLSYVMCFEGVFMLLPALVGGLYGEKEAIVYLIVGICTFAIGYIGRWKKPKKNTFYSKEGFASVSLSWILLSIIGALPFTITGEIPSYIDALFETISGVTTTGSSILSDVEALSHCTLFWRSFTHWIGGMGVLVFIMAILPLAGGSTMHMMRAESPGPTVGKLVPKVKSTAMILYGIYIGITLIEMIALLIAGMNMFEAATLTFGTVGTGGFGILNSSIGSYSTAVQIIITVFMIACSLNFNLYYLLLIRRPKDVLNNEEFRWFLGTVLTASVLITINVHHMFDSIPKAFQTVIFQVASLTSSTGYATTDFNMWPVFSKTLLVSLMLVGACAGSTGGGMKMSRAIIVAKAIKNEIFSITHPRSVQKLYLNGKPVSNEASRKVLCYMATCVVIMLASILCVSIDGKDVTTNITAVVATFNNIGPGLNEVGPTANFGSYSAFSKIVFMFDMLIGRLEIYPMLILFTQGFEMIRLPKLKRNSL